MERTKPARLGGQRDYVSDPVRVKLDGCMMKMLGNPPFSVRLVVYLMTFTIWVVVGYDFFFSDGFSDRSTLAQNAPVPSPAPPEVKKELVPPQVSSQASVQTKPTEPPLEKAGGEPFVQMQKADTAVPISKPAEIIRPLESNKGPAKNRISPAKSLRADETNLPTGDLRTGAEAKPMGSLRSPAEAGITGSLRPEEHKLPSGTLRPDEVSLPTGSLR
jgi:hypothetical protein